MSITSETTMTVRLDDGTESKPFTLDDLKNATEALKAESKEATFQRLVEVTGITLKDWKQASRMNQAQRLDFEEWLVDVPDECDVEIDPAGRQAWEEWRVAAPSFVRFTGEVRPANSETPSLEVIELILPETEEERAARLEALEDRVFSVAAKAEQKFREDNERAKATELSECVLELKFAKHPDAAKPTASLPAGTPLSQSTVQQTEPQDWPIDVLGRAKIKDLTGQSEYAGEPIGLTDAQLDKLAGALTRQTIQGLERLMREDTHWHQSIKGFGEKVISTLLNTHAALRAKFPMEQGAA